MEKKDNRDIVIKSGFWYTISNFFLKGISFITIPVFARMLTKEEFGYYNNFTAWLAVITIIGTLSLSTSLIRARFDYENELDKFISSNLILGSICTIGCYLLVLARREWVEEVFALDFKYITIMFLSIFFLPAYNMFQQTQRFLYKYKTLVAITVGVSVGSVVLSLVLMNIMENTLSARIIGAQLPIFAVSVILYCSFLKKGGGIKTGYWKYALMFCLPYVVHLLSNTVLSSIDRTMITNMCGAEETALYSMAYNIALIVNVLWDSMNSAYSPWLGEKLNAGEYNDIKKYSYGYIIIFAYGLAGGMLIAPEALYLLGGRDYVAAKYVIPPVMLGYFFLFLYSMYVNIEQYEKKTGGMAVATCAAAVLNLILNWIFIKKSGYIAAAYTTLAGYVFLFLVHYSIVKRMKMTKVYNTGFILLMIIINSILTVWITFSYRYDVFRYCLILLYVVVGGVAGYKYRNIIIGVFRKG